MKMKNLLLTIAATLGMSALTMAQNVPNYVPTNGLVGWWPFNGNANDESGNNNNGTVNGAILSADRFGNSNQAYNLNGVSDYIIIQNNSSLNVTLWSISAWVNPNGYNTGNANYIVGKGDDSNQGHYSLHFKSVSKKARPSSGFGSTGLYTDSYSNININNWVHITGSWDGNTMKVYVNGVLEDSIINPNHIQGTNAQDLFFGTMAVNNNFPYWLNGKIDDIGVWNRALTQQEVTDLYNGCQLAVNSQPASQTININNTAQFVVGSSDPGATYQWQTDLGVGFQNLNSVGQYSGTTNDTLTVSNVTISNNNQPFRCIVYSGSCSDTSNVAVLTVNNNVGINETSQDKLFSVFPNPAQSVINVKADSKLIGSVYSIYDNTGRVVLTGKLNSQSTTIELGNLSGGIYMFSVGENLKQTFKVIKE